MAAKKKAVKYGKDKNGKETWLDEDGNPAQVEETETAVTGDVPEGEKPTFDHDQTFKQPERKAWGDGQRPSSMKEETPEEPAAADAEGGDSEAGMDAEALKEIAAQMSDPAGTKWEGQENGISFDEYIKGKYGKPVNAYLSAWGKAANGK